MMRKAVPDDDNPAVSSDNENDSPVADRSVRESDVLAVATKRRKAPPKQKPQRPRSDVPSSSPTSPSRKSTRPMASKKLRPSNDPLDVP